MEIKNNLGYIRIDRLLCLKVDGITRSKARHLIKSGYISVNNKIATKGYFLNQGESLRLKTGWENLFVIPANSDIPVNIIYQDECIVAVNKPSGIHSYPLNPGENNTILNGILAQFPEVYNVNPGTSMLGLLHRLDRGTSGAILSAKEQEIFNYIRQQWRKKQVIKEYLCLVHGRLDRSADLSNFIAHDPESRNKMAVHNNKPENIKSWEAESAVEAIEHYKKFTLLKVTARTGVTHQVRAQLAHYGIPIVGDSLYGSPYSLPELKNRFFLHASRIELCLPKGEKVSIEAPLPEELVKALRIPV
ncbi:MAG TPA: RluA family pseudouridine synthase [bacterium]